MGHIITPPEPASLDFFGPPRLSRFFLLTERVEKAFFLCFLVACEKALKKGEEMSTLQRKPFQGTFVIEN